MFIRTLYILLLMVALAPGFSLRKHMDRIEHILYDEKDKELVSIVNGIFDGNGNLWLSWVARDKRPDDWREEIGKKYYTYWYVQKFDSIGAPCFPAVELAKREAGYGVSAGIHGGNRDDVYSFPGSDFRIERVDGKGNRYISDRNYRYKARNMFFGPNDYMYVTSSFSNLQMCSKFIIQETIPISVEEQNLPNEDDSAGYKYRWLRSNLQYCDSSANHIIFVVPPIIPSPSLYGDPCRVDTSRINVYHVSLPDLVTVDTSSFRISDALFKRVRGCKLRTTILTSIGSITRACGVDALVEANGDTLVLYVSSRGASEDVIYVCKLTKGGVPIRTKEVVEQRVNDFDKAPANLHREIVFRGSVAGSLGEPTGIMVYGFDNSGNVYYYVWDKSDAYWREE